MYLVIVPIKFGDMELKKKKKAMSMKGSSFCLFFFEVLLKYKKAPRSVR